MDIGRWTAVGGRGLGWQVEKQPKWAPQLDIPALAAGGRLCPGLVSSVDASRVLITFRHQSESGLGMGWAKDLSNAVDPAQQKLWREQEDQMEWRLRKATPTKKAAHLDSHYSQAERRPEVFSLHVQS